MSARRQKKPAPLRPARQKQVWRTLLASQETHQRIEELVDLLGRADIGGRRPSKHQAVLTAVLEAIQRRRN